MPVVSISLMNLPGTEAAVGWAGSHCIIADRPEGKAGGLGLGFNGAQLLALAIGGADVDVGRMDEADFDGGSRLGLGNSGSSLDKAASDER